MKHRRDRRTFTVLTSSIFLALALRPAPSDPAISDLRRMSGTNPVDLRELAAWVARPARGTDSQGFHALRPEDLAAATSLVPRQLGLFPRSASAEEQRRFLHDVPYGSAMARAAARHRVDGLLLAAVVETESGFVPDRISPRGAMGLMQVLPSTGEEYGATDLLDPGVNLDVGSRYLGELITDYRGNLVLALAAYNAGPGAVERYGGVPPYPETRDYVRRVLTLYGEHHQTAGSDRDPFSPPVDAF
jgi:soluble lytic murein transglycosylase-like protein